MTVKPGNEVREVLTAPAPPGKVWRCYHCGKRSRTRCGWDAEGKRTTIDQGWDEACILNAQLVDESPG